MIWRILPSYVVSVDAFEDAVDGVLFPDEAAVVEHAVEKRRREFTTGRVCARKALQRLGRPAAPLLPGPHGEPQWPSGTVGSITHCHGYRGVAVGETARAASIGIDAEPNEPLPDTLLDSISLPRERADVAKLERNYPGVRWDRLLFCAKEATYKTWYTFTGAWLGFDAAEIHLEPREWTGTFTARFLGDAPEFDGVAIREFSGRWMLGRELLLTAIVVPATVPAPSASLSV